MKYYNMGIPCETLPTNCTGIYLIKNLVNNKIYIGQSADIKRRIQEYLRSAQPEKYSKKSERDSKTHLHLAMKKYGIENFSVNILQICEKENLDTLEKKWILLLNSDDPNSGYNETPGGQKSFAPSGEKHSQAKLTQKEVDEIKSLLKNTKMTLGEISNKFYGISKSTISMINHGKIWTDNNTNYPIRKPEYGSIGEKNPKAKFSESQVIEMRTKYSQGEALKDIQDEYEQYGSRSAIQAIIYGQSFKHLPIWSNTDKCWKMKRVSTIPSVKKGGEVGTLE